MTNALVKNMTKKKKPSKTLPAPPPPTYSVEAVSRPSKIHGMEPDRYYRADSTLDVLTRAEEHRRDKKLMSDVQRVAASKQAAMSRAVGKPRRS